MKAALCRNYGPPSVLEIAEVPTPSPGERELLLRIRAATVSSADRRVRSFDMPRGFGLVARLAFGARRPRQPILGVDFAADVVEVGRSVTRFKVGDRVFGMRGARMGCHAQFACIREDAALALAPAALGYAEAAAIPFGGTTVLGFFRRAKLGAGERVLVHGASGSVGTAAIQLAVRFGAEVTGVCSGANVGLARSLGATRAIDYAREDFARERAAYDVIVDTVGTAGFARCRQALRPGGRLLLVEASLPQMLAAPLVALTDSRRVVAGPAPERAEDLRFLARLADTGEFRPVIDRRYAFERIAEAHAYVDTWRKRGNVILEITPD